VGNFHLYRSQGSACSLRPKSLEERQLLTYEIDQTQIHANEYKIFFGMPRDDFLADPSGGPL